MGPASAPSADRGPPHRSERGPRCEPRATTGATPTSCDRDRSSYETGLTQTPSQSAAPVRVLDAFRGWNIWIKCAAAVGRGGHVIARLHLAVISTIRRRAMSARANSGLPACRCGRRFATTSAARCRPADVQQRSNPLVFWLGRLPAPRTFWLQLGYLVRPRCRPLRLRWPRSARRSSRSRSMKRSTTSRSTLGRPVSQQGGCPLRSTVLGSSIPRLS